MSVSVNSAVKELSHLRPGSTVSLVDAGSSLFAVSTDRESQALSVIEIPFSAESLHTESARTVLEDKIDGGPTLSPRFGQFAAAAAGSVPNVVYLDSVSESAAVLKWISRPKTDWRVDTLEPAGQPVALCPASGAVPLAFWAAGGSLLESDGKEAPRVVSEPFSSATPGCSAGDGFTVWDLSSDRLLFIRPSTTGASISEVPDGGPIHASTLRKDGMLAVAVYEPDSKSIFLLEEESSDTAGQSLKMKKILVVQSGGTGCLALSPYASGYLFLYDSVQGPGENRTHALCLLYPWQGRYERAVIFSSKEPIAGMKAVFREDSFYVLVSGSTLDLVSVSLSSK
jgi:hypothetical protein